MGSSFLGLLASHPKVENSQSDLRAGGGKYLCLEDD